MSLVADTGPSLSIAHNTEGRTGEPYPIPLCILGQSYARTSISNPVSLRLGSSYDFGAAVHETRALSAKYDELKRQGIFLRSSPSFRKTDWIRDSITGIPGVTIAGSGAFATLLHNPDTGTSFYVTRQNDSTSMHASKISIPGLD